MNIFISWSGPVSRRVATAFHKWLPLIFENRVHILISNEILPGVNSFKEICRLLNEADFGLICLTPDNLRNPWINFEAGALYTKNICPLLFDVESKELVDSHPLYYYHHTTVAKDDIMKLVKQINNNISDNEKMSEERIENLFNQRWEYLESSFSQIRESSILAERLGPVVKRTDRDPIRSSILGYKEFLIKYLPYVPEWTKLKVISRTPVIFFKEEVNSTDEKRMWYHGLCQRIFDDGKYPTDFFVSKWHMVKYLRENEKQCDKILREWYAVYDRAKEASVAGGYGFEVYVVDPGHFPSISLIYAEQSLKQVTQYYLMVQFREDMYNIDESMNSFTIEDKENVDSEYWICHMERTNDCGLVSEWRQIVKELIEGKFGKRGNLKWESLPFPKFAHEMCDRFGLSHDFIDR